MAEGRGEDRTRAEELFAEFLAEGDDDPALRFDAWVSAYPAHEAELRELHGRWAEFRPLLERLVSSPGGPDPRTEAVLAALRRRGAGLRFSLEDEIGRGGMGRVYRVFDPELERELALKVARDEEETRGDTPNGTPSSRRRVDRFLEEARITGRLQHPGIVPVHELGVDAEGRVFYTMPLIEGLDLEQVLDAARGGEDAAGARVRALGVLRRVCDTMAYAHSRGVVHGDLKPANVRIGRFGEVTVMDWGLARRVDAPDREGRAPEPGPDLEDLGGPAGPSRVGGTPAYLAPERVLDPGAPPDPRDDVYAVGAMLYRLLAGRVPHQDRLASVTDLEDLREALRTPPRPVGELAREVPAELASICARALAPRADRYPSMAELGDDLAAFLEGRVVRAHAVGAWAELRKWIGRNRTTAAALAALVVSLAVGLSASSFLYVRAGRETARVLRLSDLRRHRELVAEAESLWPALPERIPDYEAWLGRADDLAERLPLHRATLAELRAGARSSEEGAPVFASGEERWHHDSLANLVGELEGFLDPGRGLVADVRKRLEFARTVDERSRSSPSARALWDEATRSLADADEAPAYGRLALAPQLGLLPLGPDPDSGLQEFAHLESGVPPGRGPDGLLHLDEDSSIVLVLIPGGTFLMGAQSTDPDAPGYSRDAFANEGPPGEVTLAPYFLSKYELTQAQWLRLAGSNPSTVTPASAPGDVTLLHPVETIGRGEALRVLERRALTLPTEAQWERAARGDTTTVWWTGDDPRTLQDAANLADQAVVRAGGEWPQIERWLDDGFHRHAPVDALLPNPFGLHHVHGNVWEWCKDDFGGYENEPRPGDGLRRPAEPGLAVGRGGGYVNNAAYARSSLRDGRPDAPHLLFGVRPARAVQP